MARYLLIPVMNNRLYYRYIHNQMLRDEILKNYQVKKFTVEILKGFYDLSKSTLLRAVKISVLMTVFSAVFILECKMLSANGNKIIGIDMNDYTSSVCPKLENYYEIIMKIKTVGLLIGSAFGSINFFMKID